MKKYKYKLAYCKVHSPYDKLADWNFTYSNDLDKLLIFIKKHSSKIKQYTIYRYDTPLYSNSIATQANYKAENIFKEVIHNVY